MKIAILIPGLTRSYKKVYKSYNENVLKPNNNHEIDTYLAFWTHTHVRDKRSNSGQKGHRELGQEEIEDVIETYSPKKYLIMDDYKEKNKFFKKHTNPLASVIGKDKRHHNPYSLIQNGIIAQTYVWSKVFSLIENEYDLIVKSRFDIAYRKKVIFEDIDLHAFSCAGKTQKDRGKTQWESYGICDILFAGNYDTMKKVMNDYHESVIDKTLLKNLPRVTPEYMLKSLLNNRYNIPIKPIGNGAFLDIKYK